MDIRHLTTKNNEIEKASTTKPNLNEQSTVLGHHMIGCLSNPTISYGAVAIVTFDFLALFTGHYHVTGKLTFSPQLHLL